MDLPDIENQSQTSITVSWSIQSIAKGAIHKGYEVQYKKSEGNETFTKRHQRIRNQTRIKLTGLTPGQFYDIQIRTLSSEGNSDWSPANTAKTNNPIKEGLVAMLGPAIDTLIVCTLTALAILTTLAPLPTLATLTT